MDAGIKNQTAFVARSIVIRGPQRLTRLCARCWAPTAGRNWPRASIIGFQKSYKGDSVIPLLTSTSYLMHRGERSRLHDKVCNIPCITAIIRGIGDFDVDRLSAKHRKPPLKLPQTLSPQKADNKNPPPIHFQGH